MPRRRIIQVFEHQALKIGQSTLGVVFTPAHFLALEKLYGEKGVPFYSLIYQGVRFCEYVGALQVGDLLIQVLPKADRSSDTARWNRVLLGMLRAVHGFDVSAPSSAGLKLRPHSVLDLYFELFVAEAEQLLHRGLIRAYRREDGNCAALRGRIVFAQHLQHNVIHQERFFTRHSVYDCDGIYNQLLLKTLHLLRRINTGAELQGRISALLLQFPELSDVQVDEALFSRLTYTRKTEPYKKALTIARLLLLNFHPDVSLGRTDVLALMFDMNLLWERFVYVSLRRLAASCPDLTSLSAQSGKEFWQPFKGRKTTIRPDILLTMKDGRVVVLDTKWKNLNGSAPSADDLRQLYAYSRFYDNANAALVYPGERMSAPIGTFLDGGNARCGVVTVGVDESMAEWQEALANHIFSSVLFS
jgi:5-methylcytosine-specific restriction enzyme subunit McrC